MKPRNHSTLYRIPLIFLMVFLLTPACDRSMSQSSCTSVLDCGPGEYCHPEKGVCVSGKPDPGEIPDLDGGLPLEDGNLSDSGPLEDAAIPDGDVVEIEDPVRVCRYIPPPGEFAPIRKCFWNEPSTFPDSDDVVMTPVVANLTDDNGDGIIDTRDIPDIAFVSYRYREDGCCNSPGILRVVSGRCGEDGHLIEHFSINSPVLDNSAGLAIGDIDGDGVPDIVAMKRSSGTVAYDNMGNVKWESPHPQGSDNYTAVQPAIVDLDGDGIAEILVGRVVLCGLTGLIKWRGVGGLGINGFLGPMSLAADINLDGRPEVIAGNTVYRADGLLLWQFDFPSASSRCRASEQGRPCDGYAAVGDFDDDPEAEIVIVRAGDVWILNHDGTLLAKLEIPVDNCGYNEGGPPTIADFDGDGRAEIGVAGADFYVVFDLDCCDELPHCPGIPQGEDYCEAPGIRWSFPTDDCSSRVTGSSVFDFDGDGRAEVVYNDERYFRIFDGMDGTVLVEIPNRSHTRLEYPIIADVNNDGNANIVFIENSNVIGNLNRGIHVWGDGEDRWVPTRRIWNQHMYNITNITEEGLLPPYNHLPNWLVFNNFRQNLPDYDVFSAPDLQVEIMGVDRTGCNQRLGLRTRVCNFGSLRVGPGVPVNFYNRNTGQEYACENPVFTADTLEPEECEEHMCVILSPPLRPALLEVRACVDNGSFACDSAGMNNECHEDNNLFDYSTDGCDGPVG